MSAELAQRHHERAVRSLQAEARVPAVTAAIARANRPLWQLQVGTAGRGAPLGPGTQFRMGSITKTFTAALILQARDEGLLGLDDRIGAHLDVRSHPDLTIRQLLTHTSGLQREPDGNLWDALEVPTAAETIEGLARAEAVLPPHRRLHYSNLAYAVLGHLVAAKRGGSWEEVLADRLLRPLGLHDTTVAPREPRAQGYLVEAYSDHARPEPEFPIGGVGPAAQLWSTAADLARWALFLADPDPSVLRPETVDEACVPQAVPDAEAWSAAWGLGLILVPRGGRAIDAGHDGAMPGFLAGMYFRRRGRIGAAVLGSSGQALAVCAAPSELISASLEHDPPDVEPWVPGEPAPPEFASVLGIWWSEGFEYVFSWRGGKLQARAAAAPADRPPTVFAAESSELLRAVAGREVGERLELTRDDAGNVVFMRWASYRVTRTQQTFDPAEHAGYPPAGGGRGRYDG